MWVFCHLTLCLLSAELQHASSHYPIWGLQQTCFGKFHKLFVASLPLSYLRLFHITSTHQDSWLQTKEMFSILSKKGIYWKNIKKVTGRWSWPRWEQPQKNQVEQKSSRSTGASIPSFPASLGSAIPRAARHSMRHKESLKDPCFLVVSKNVMPWVEAYAWLSLGNLRGWMEKPTQFSINDQDISPSFCL